MTEFDFPSISILDRYLSDETDPFSSLHLSHQLEGHERVLAKQRQMCGQITEILGHLGGRIPHPKICRSDNQFLLDDQPLKDNNHLSWSLYAITDEQLNDNTEVMSLQNLLDMAVTLAIYQETHGETASQTLRKRFELAKAVERSGNHEEAEHHCCIILDASPHIEVLTFLGMMLMKAYLLTDATFKLFRALTEFIVQYSSSSIELNTWFFKSIKELFTELALRDDDHVWSSLTSCLFNMMDTIREGISQNVIDQIPSQLFLHGFCFARECTILGFIDSATYIYQVLLKFSPDELDAVRHGIEKAKAHQGYGLLLRQENRWTSSAEQLILACESIMSSGTQDSELVAVLENDYVELVEHLPAHTHGEKSLIERLRGMLAECRSQNLPQVQELSAAIPDSRIEDYLLSDDCPIQLSALRPSIASHVTQFGLRFNVTETLPRSRDHTSTESVSVSGSSNKYGVTCSIGSGASIVSNSYLLGL